MTPDDEALISAEIDRAHAFAERGADRMAAHAFAATRSLSVGLADRKALDKKIRYINRKSVRERERYREIIAQQRPLGAPLVVFSDSLGLPRAVEADGAYDGAERTYPFMLLDRLPHHSVNSYCQRYFTTRHVLDLLHSDSALGLESDVVVHVGLNDAPWRMFSETDRLSLDLLPPELKDRIVGFAQKYRKLIISELPEYHYVDPPDFQANVDAILETLNHRKARVMVTTIILPPVRFWPSTPGLQRNFARYNLILMDAAHRHGATAIDLDRLVWDKQHDGVLLPDGMHLSVAGHALVAEQVASRLS